MAKAVAVSIGTKELGGVSTVFRGIGVALRRLIWGSLDKGYVL